MKDKFLALVIVPVLFVVFFSFNSASADTALVDLKVCYPSIRPSADSKIIIKKGDVLSFACKIANKGAVANVLLSGEMTKETDAKILSSVSSAVTVPKQGEVVSKVSLPVFVNDGNYKITLSLGDSSNGKKIGSDLTFTAVLSTPIVKAVKTGVTNIPEGAYLFWGIDVSVFVGIAVVLILILGYSLWRMRHYKSDVLPAGNVQ